MGREVRKVPADWQHPKDDKGRYRRTRRNTPTPTLHPMSSSR